uniref:Magnesium transporter MRS2 homolog, mitochondrial n=2 Tax=Marmota marmota marmota TaxID=9994 RepID=A0A8C5YK87_MARMA
MELLLENYHRLAEDLSNAARELRVLIDDSQSIIFINLDSHRNVMMRLNLQLTMGTFSVSLFGLMGVAFGMNLESSLEEDHRVFWLITGIMFLGSGLIWRRLLSFLGRQLEAPLPPMVLGTRPRVLLSTSGAHGPSPSSALAPPEKFQNTDAGSTTWVSVKASAFWFVATS